MESQEINNQLGGLLKQNVQLADYCQVGVGGAALFFVEVSDISELIMAVLFAQQEGMPYVVIGNGSKVLFSDEPYEGVVIVNKSSRILPVEGTSTVVADSGVGMAQLINFAAQRSLSGLESHYCLPETLGGVLCTETYASRHVSEHVRSVTLLTSRGKILKKSGEWLRDKSNRSRLRDLRRPWIILVVALQLQWRQGRDIQVDIAKQQRLKEYYSQKRILHNIFLDSIEEGHSEKLIRKSGMFRLKQDGCDIPRNCYNCIRNIKAESSRQVRDFIERVQSEVSAKEGEYMQESIYYLGKWQ